MSEVDAFLHETLPRQIEAERALHEGDPELRTAMWSRNDPVTMLGALGVLLSGWDELEPFFRWLASRFSDCTAYDFELIAAAASGDVAYTVGLEHCTRSWEGRPPEAVTVRATHSYRREGGQWKIVHRHGDGLATDPPLRSRGEAGLGEVSEGSNVPVGDRGAVAE